MGPQVAYFAPQILMEQDVHAPTIDARGAAFPGVNLFVQLGRGRDYAWSATSAGQDLIDTFAVPLCNTGGRPAVAELQRLPVQGPVPAVRGADPDQLLDPEPRPTRPRPARRR